MTKTQSEIHLIICQHGEITLSALAELTGKSKTNLSNILARLKEQGKITRSDTATYKNLQKVRKSMYQVKDSMTTVRGSQPPRTHDY